MMTKVQCSFHLKTLAFNLITVFWFIDHKTFKEIFQEHFSNKKIFPLDGRAEVIKLFQIPSGARWQKEVIERNQEEEKCARNIRKGEMTSLMFIYLWSFKDFRVIV